jgi:hypothetical protein
MKSGGRDVSLGRTTTLAGVIAPMTKLAYPAQNGHFFCGVEGLVGADEFCARVMPLWQMGSRATSGPACAPYAPFRAHAVA